MKQPHLRCEAGVIWGPELTSAIDLSAAVDVYGEWVDAAGKQSYYSDACIALCVLTIFSPPDAVAQEEGSASRPIYDGPSRMGGRKHADEEDEGNDYEGDGIVADDVIDDD